MPAIEASWVMGSKFLFNPLPHWQCRLMLTKLKEVVALAQQTLPCPRSMSVPRCNATLRKYMLHNPCLSHCLCQLPRLQAAARPWRAAVCVDQHDHFRVSRYDVVTLCNLTLWPTSINAPQSYALANFNPLQVAARPWRTVTS